MSDVTVPALQQRKLIYDKMTPTARDLADEIMKTVKTVHRNTVIGCWMVGKALATALDPKREGDFGSDVLNQYSAYLPESLVGSGSTTGKRQTLLNLKNFYQRFPNSQFIADWSEKAMPKGNYLELSHWMALMSLTKMKDVEARLKETIQKGLSAKELNLILKSGEGGPRHPARGSGRSPMVPSTPMAGLQRLFADTQKVVRQLPVVDEHVFTKILDLPPDEVNDVLLNKLKEDQSMLDTLVVKGSEAKERLTECINRVETVLQERKQADIDKSWEEGTPKAAATEGAADTESATNKGKGKSAGKAAATEGAADTESATNKGKGKSAGKAAATTGAGKSKPSAGKKAGSNGKAGSAPRSSKRPQPATV